MRPISTEGLIYAENMKDGFVTYEDMVGEGFARWMTDGIPNYEEIVGQKQADSCREQVALVHHGDFQGVERSMGFIREEAEKWILKEGTNIPVCPKTIWTSGVRERRPIKDEGRVYSWLGIIRPALARSTENMPPSVVQAAGRDNHSTCENTSTQQRRDVRDKQTVATEEEREHYEGGLESPSEQDAVSEEVSVSAEVQGDQHWEMAQYVLLGHKLDVSDGDSDYVSWTLEDEWEVN